MQKKSRSIALAVVAVGISCATATAAEPTARVEYTDAFTTRAPGSPSGRVFYDEFFDARDANAKPPAVQHVHLQLPKGAHFDTAAVPRCTASDAELMAQGPSACDPRSQVGSEVYSFDTGADGPNRLVTSDEDGKYPVTGWLTTPPTCPASGKWTFRVDYTFRNGEKVTKTSDSPCNQPRIAFFHRQHGRSMRVYSSAPTTARLRIYRGAGRVYDSSVRLERGVNTLRLPALRKGTYRLTLGAGAASLRIS